MATYNELNQFFHTLYDRDFPRSTLSKWSVEGKIYRIKNDKGKWDYDLDSFKRVVTGEEYKKKVRASKENPKNYIGKQVGHLLITGIVPKEEYKENYKGTLMWCDCLRCGKKHFQVRFSYLTPNGNYSQDSCGCSRKIQAFLATIKQDIDENFIEQFDDIDKFMFVHKMISGSVTDGYYTNCPVEEYKQAITTIYYDKQFIHVYNFWKSQTEKYKTFYDWAKPSIDHIVPKSRGGSNNIENLQILTVFENLNKRDMTQDEWTYFKQVTNTQSDYFIENIIRKAGDEE